MLFVPLINDGQKRPGKKIRCFKKNNENWFDSEYLLTLPIIEEVAP